VNAKKKTRSKRRDTKSRKRPLVPIAVACLAGLASFVYLTGWPLGGGANFQALQGKWLRVDGRYVIEIRNVADDGEMEAAYFNPNPINVSRAQAIRSDDTIKVFVELKDVNYPGSTYDLTYDPGEEVLEGIYFQAVQKQQFSVRFIRME
jgi:hypothetical protein